MFSLVVFLWLNQIEIVDFSRWRLGYYLFRVPKGFRAPGLQGSRAPALKMRAPGLQDENFRALGLHIICFRDPGSTLVYNLDM